MVNPGQRRGELVLPLIAATLAFVAVLCLPLHCEVEMLLLHTFCDETLVVAAATAILVAQLQLNYVYLLSC